jgi:hypothetical protein
MRYIIFFLIIFSLFQPALATPFGDAMANYTNSSTISNVGPYYPEISWTPDYDQVNDKCKRDNSPKFVYGWLDIIGFDGMIKIGNISYINESLNASAIIQYKTYACVLGHRLAMHGWDYKLDVFEKNGKAIAELTATAILYGIKTSNNIK